MNINSEDYSEDTSAFLLLVWIPLLIGLISSFAIASLLIGNVRGAYVILAVAPLCSIVKSIERLRQFCRNNLQLEPISESARNMLEPDSFRKFLSVYFQKGWPVFVSVYSLFSIVIIIYWANS